MVYFGSYPQTNLNENVPDLDYALSWPPLLAHLSIITYMYFLAKLRILGAQMKDRTQVALYTLFMHACVGSYCPCQSGCSTYLNCKNPGPRTIMGTALCSLYKLPVTPQHRKRLSVALLVSIVPQTLDNTY